LKTPPWFGCPRTPKAGRISRSLGTLVALAVLSGFAPAARAEDDPQFAKLRDAAEPVGGLGAFIERYAGNCAEGSAVNGECLERAKAFRAKASGKRYFMMVSEDQAILALGGGGGGFTWNLTPFFPAAGSAVTHGAPTKTDAQGNPVLPYFVVPGRAPEMGSPERLLASRALRLEIVFTPVGLWQLPKKGGGKTTGIKAKLEAVAVKVGRTGETVGVWTR
jgi:Family of unknown function (DUF6066)